MLKDLSISPDSAFIFRNYCDDPNANSCDVVFMASLLEPFMSITLREPHSPREQLKADAALPISPGGSIMKRPDAEVKKVTSPASLWTSETY